MYAPNNPYSGGAAATPSTATSNLYANPYANVGGHHNAYTGSTTGAGQYSFPTGTTPAVAGGGGGSNNPYAASNPYDVQAAQYEPREYVLDEPWYQPCTAVATDPQQELVWVGYADGRMASFRYPSVRPYTAFRAHIDAAASHSGGASGVVAVTQILPTESGTLSLSSGRINVHRRGGVYVQELFQPRGDRFVGLRCICLLYTSPSPRDRG